MASNSHDDQGATPRELLLESCRRNNTDLLLQLLQYDIPKSTTTTPSSRQPTQRPLSTEQGIAELLNTATDGIGNHSLHLAATHGSYEVMDILLDQAGVEVDPVDRLEGDTPLHKAVRYINNLAQDSRPEGKLLVELLLDAGADPRIRNKAKLKAFDLVDPTFAELRDVLNRAEFMLVAGDDVIDEERDDGRAGSASDSD